MLQPLTDELLLFRVELIPVLRRAEVTIGEFLEGRECASAMQATHTANPQYQFVIDRVLERYAWKYLSNQF